MPSKSAICFISMVVLGAFLLTKINALHEALQSRGSHFQQIWRIFHLDLLQLSKHLLHSNDDWRSSSHPLIGCCGLCYMKLQFVLTTHFLFYCDSYHCQHSSNVALSQDHLCHWWWLTWHFSRCWVLGLMSSLLHCWSACWDPHVGVDTGPCLQLASSLPLCRSAVISQGSMVALTAS